MIVKESLKVLRNIEIKLERVRSDKKDLMLYRIIKHDIVTIFDVSTAHIDVSLIIYGKGIMGFRITVDSFGNSYGLSDLNETIAMIEELDSFEFTGKAKKVHNHLKNLFQRTYVWTPRAGVKGSTIKELVLERNKLQKEEDEKGKENTMTVENGMVTVTYHGIELKIKEEKMDEYNSLTSEIDELFKIEYAKSEEAKSEIVRYITRYFRLNPFKRDDLSQDEKDNYHLESLHELARMLEVHDIKFFTKWGMISSLEKFGIYHAKSHNNGVLKKAIETISRETPDGMLFMFDYEKLGDLLVYNNDEDPDSRYKYIHRVEDDYDTIIVVLDRIKDLFDYPFKHDPESIGKRWIVNSAHGIDPIEAPITKLI